MDGHPVDRAAPARPDELVPGRQGQPPPLHGEGDLRAAGGGRPHARPLRRFRRRARLRRRRCPSRSQDLRRHLDHGLRHGLLRRARRANTGSSGWPGCRSRSMSRPSSATARRRSIRASSRIVRLAVGRDGRHAGLAALRQGAGPAHRSRSSTCRPRPSRARATPSRRRSPGPRSASPRPRPSPASSRRCCRSRSRPGASAARCREAEEKRLVAALIGVPGLMTEALHARGADRAPGPRARQAPRTCSISAAAPPIRWRSKAR